MPTSNNQFCRPRTNSSSYSSRNIETFLPYLSGFQRSKAMALPRLQTVTARPTEPLLEQILQVTGRLPITLGMATPTNIFVHTNDLIATSLSTIYHGQGTITKPGEAGTVNIVQRTVAMLKPGQWVRRTAYTRITDTAPNTE